MLIAAAIVPGPPAFVVELMGQAASELDDLREAADRVISRVLDDLLIVSIGSTSADAGTGSILGSGSHSGSGSRSGSGLGLGPVPVPVPVQLVIVGPGEPGEFHATGPVSFAGFGRAIVIPALVEGQQDERVPAPVEGQQNEGDLPTPIMVARYLASRDIAAHPEHARLWAAARWVTTDGREATALGERLGAGGVGIGLILVADGAACHGPKAPRAQDPRAGAYDDEVCTALGSGQPSRLAQIDVQLGEELGATGFRVWPVLVAASGGEGVGELAWAGAPYGVGWAVASWRRPTTRTDATRT